MFCSGAAGLPGGGCEAGRAAAAALCHSLTVVALVARLAAGLAATAALNCWAVAGGSAAPTAARRPASLRSPVRTGPGQTGSPVSPSLATISNYIKNVPIIQF